MKTLCSIFKSSLKCLLIIIVIGMATTGCMKEDADSTILVKIDKSLYPYLFDKGSYWNYNMYPLIADTLQTVIKDSLGLSKDSIVFVNDTIPVTDSVTVESIEKDTLYITGNVRYYEYYRINYHSTYENVSYTDNLMGYIISRGTYNGGYLFLSSKKKGDKSQNAEIIAILDELKVENRTYRQVIKMKVLKDQYINDNYYLYFVNNVGIIKKEKEVNKAIVETWNLRNYKVNLLKVTN